MLEPNSQAVMLNLPVSCRSLGCLDPQCVLCEHNPHRRCNVNFAPKYLVNDVLKAKCDAPIRVEIIDRQTGVPLGEDIADVHLEVGLFAILISVFHVQPALQRHARVFLHVILGGVSTLLVVFVSAVSRS